MKSLLLALTVLSLNSQAAYRLLPVVTTGLTRPVEVLPDPSAKGALFIVEQTGRILRWTALGLDSRPFADFKQRVISGGEMGLLSMALAPDFATSGVYYVNYTAHINSVLHTVVARMWKGKVEEERILTFKQPFTNHNGGQLAFAKDGYLYIATGDGGSANDPEGNGQKLDVWLGKILRIDVSGKDSQGRFDYRIPETNPFKSGARPEIYAYGLRNPWRFSFDSQTQMLITADVGQNELEEIHRIDAGGNYGWNRKEGTKCFKPKTKCEGPGMPALIDPLHEYGRDEGYSITGGYIYRGKAIPALNGVYVYADYGSGKIWGLALDKDQKKKVSNELLVGSNLPVSSFGLDADGEILVVSHSGGIFRLAAPDVR